VLDEPSFRANAERLAAAIAAETAEDRAVEELEGLVRPAPKEATVLAKG
jgi:UDP:flavonoid glycosyltransferase YjiC (YdhE family)